MNNSLSNNFVSKAKFKYGFRFRVTFEVSCILEGEEYPFDKHSCSFRIKSCKFQCNWTPVQIDPIPDYHDKHSITCSSELRTPLQTGIENVKSLQHLVDWDKLKEEERTLSMSSGKYQPLSV